MPEESDADSAADRDPDRGHHRARDDESARGETEVEDALEGLLGHGSHR